MPNRDGTGPLGKGKLTGRKMGNCKEDDDEEEFNVKKKGNKKIVLPLKKNVKKPSLKKIKKK